MIVAGDREHAAIGRSARRVGMLERIGRAIDAGPLAVPDAEHAIDFCAGKHPDLLAAPHRGGREIFVQAGDESDVVSLQERFGPPQRVVVHAERRAAVARDEARGIEVLPPIALALQQRQSHQGLNSGEIDSLRVEAVFVVQPNLHQRHLACSVRCGGSVKRMCRQCQCARRTHRSTNKQMLVTKPAHRE